jgi:hypothetical protein
MGNTNLKSLVGMFPLHKVRILQRKKAFLRLIFLMLLVLEVPQQEPGKLDCHILHLHKDIQNDINEQGSQPATTKKDKYNI